MARYVLNGNELDSKKADAKAKVARQLGSSVMISGNTIEVKFAVDESKVAQILSACGVSYSGG